MKPILREADAETLAILQAIDIDELRGISNQVAKSVKTQLQTVVMSGVAFDKAVEKVMTSSDKLTQYASTYMNTSRSMLSQKVSDLSAENYKEEGGVVYWEYFGALPDEKTRDECLMGLGVQPSGSYPNAPFFTDDEKIGFQSEFGIRWNCRHEFNQITEDYYEEMTGNSAKNISEYDEGVFNKYNNLSTQEWDNNVKNLSIDLEKTLQSKGFKTSINHSHTFMGHSSYLSYSSPNVMKYKKWKHPIVKTVKIDNLPTDIKLWDVLGNPKNIKHRYRRDLSDEILKTYNLNSEKVITHKHIIETLHKRGNVNIAYKEYTYSADTSLSFNVRISNHSVGTKRMVEHYHIMSYKNIQEFLDKIFNQYKELLND